MPVYSFQNVCLNLYISIHIHDWNWRSLLTIPASNPLKRRGLKTAPERNLNMTHRNNCCSRKPRVSPLGLARSSSGRFIQHYLELVPGWAAPSGSPLPSAPLTTLSGLWRHKLALWVTSCSILFLMATSKPLRGKRSCVITIIAQTHWRTYWEMLMRKWERQKLTHLVERVLTFFSFCCSTTWAFLGAMVLASQKEKHRLSNLKIRLPAF